MPNIEIHGISSPLKTSVMQGKIFNLFRDQPYADEMVVTRYATEVTDRHGKSQPFLRLVNSDQEHIPEILERLQTLNIDIEHLVLAKFIPKKPEEPKKSAAYQHYGHPFS